MLESLLFAYSEMKKGAAPFNFELDTMAMVMFYEAWKEVVK